MKPKHILLVVFLFSTLNGFTQAVWEVNFVRNANPVNPNNQLWKTLSSTEKPIVIGVPMGMFVAGLITKNKDLQIDAYETAAGLVITTLATQSLKAIVKRPRPYRTYADIYPDEMDDSYSFPSGHTSSVFFIATSLALTCKKWYITVPAFTWATGVGYSRMYLGQHYPSDVFVGAVVGAGSAYASHWLNKKFFLRKKKITQLP
ncbi:MAG: phosphatase PAP2 family protein [Bacteroidota bacterium]